MSDDLVTLSTFWSEGEAALAKNLLEEYGIQAVLDGENFATMEWQMANATGGIRLHVRQADVEQALAALGARLAKSDEAAPPADENEEDEPEPAEEDAEAKYTLRERMANRVLRGLIIGLVVFPIQLLVFWMLFRIYLSDEPLRWELRKKALLAAALVVPALIFDLWLFQYWILVFID
jgi:hypothetical protein